MAFATGRLKDEVSSWPGISVHPHRFAALEYRFGKAEVGHVHFWGDVDIPFPRPVRDSLLERNLAEQHRWIPGWTTFRISGQKEIEHAIWLMRLSFDPLSPHAATTVMPSNPASCATWSKFSIACWVQ